MESPDEEVLEDTPAQHRHKVMIAILLILLMVFGYLLL